MSTPMPAPNATSTVPSDTPTNAPPDAPPTASPDATSTVRRAALIVLATLALNTLIAAMLVAVGISTAFGPAFVQSQAIGLPIAAACWSVAPWVARAEGDVRVAVPLFGAAIVAGVLVGLALAGWASGVFFPGAPAPGVDPGRVTVRTAILSIACGVLVTLAFYGRERLRHARLRADAEGWRAVAAERSAAQAQLQALRAQVEPHFLFNTLAGVSALIERDPPAARAMLDEFARHLRATLRHARAETTTLGEELDVTASLLGVMQRRLGERLQWRFDVPEPLRALRLPPMLVQPLVENAVKHGIEPLAVGGAIEVRARREADGRLSVEVADTGRGLAEDTAPRDPGGGTGLANLAQRLRAIYGPDARLALRENRPRGTVARLVLPIPDPAR
jgi:signal transduction histidine kinase